VTSLTLDVVDPELLLTWTDTTICAGDQIEIMELLGEDNFSWVPTEQVASGGDTNNPTLAPTQDVTYTVTATISDCPANAMASVTVAAAPIVSITADPAGDVAIGTDVNFTANITNPTPGDQYIWTYNGVVQDSMTQSINIRMLEEGLANNITVTVINESGCEATATTNVNGTIPDYRTPNVFTPDGDGLNDYFNITYVGQEGDQGLGPVEVIRFSVWNRWGNLVYNNETPDLGWDGTHEGKPAPSDVYVYMIQVELPNGEVRTIKGENGSDVTLIR
jgi:gliding motility-associated-like protein